MNQLLVALCHRAFWRWTHSQLACAAIYALAMWARKDMARVEKELLEKVHARFFSWSQSWTYVENSMHTVH